MKKNLASADLCKGVEVVFCYLQRVQRDFLHSTILKFVKLSENISLESFYCHSRFSTRSRQVAARLSGLNRTHSGAHHRTCFCSTIICKDADGITLSVTHLPGLGHLNMLTTTNDVDVSASLPLGYS